MSQIDITSQAEKNPVYGLQILVLYRNEFMIETRIFHFVNLGNLSTPSIKSILQKQNKLDFPTFVQV